MNFVFLRRRDTKTNFSANSEVQLFSKISCIITFR